MLKLKYRQASKSDITIFAKQAVYGSVQYVTFRIGCTIMKLRDCCCSVNYCIIIGFDCKSKHKKHFYEFSLVYQPPSEIDRFIFKTFQVQKLKPIASMG